MVAATLPGHANTPAPEDYSIERAAQLAAALAEHVRADVVVGFSMGATVAYEMVVSGAWAGPLVLLGISLSLKDEPAFLRAMDRAAAVAGSLPFAAMRQMMGSMAKHLRVPEERRAELLADLRNNDPATMRQIFRGYLHELARDDQPAQRLCKTGEQIWIVHADKGDGGLTDDERRTLENCPTATVTRLPGTSWFLPCEEPAPIAELICKALPD
jgi:pimeloyl-ACP methyl ester carboxylesterase